MQQQQGQAEQMRQAALSRIHPSPSPFLLVPQTPAPQQVPDTLPPYPSCSGHVVLWLAV